VGKKPKPSNEEVLASLRGSVAPHVPIRLPPENSSEKNSSPAPTRKIVTVEFIEQHDGTWEWHEPDGMLAGTFRAERLGDLEIDVTDTLRAQITVSGDSIELLQVVPSTHKRLPDKQRKERLRELRRLRTPAPEKKITHLYAAPPPGLRRVIAADITGVDGTCITWRALHGEEAMTCTSPRADQLVAGQRVNVVLQELNGALEFLEIVPHTTTPRPQTPKPKLSELQLDAMYHLEPGDIVDAFIAFTGTPGIHDSGRDGKTRPAIFLAKRGTSVLLRGLTDGEGSYSQRRGSTPIRDWSEAGLAKPSVVLLEDQEVDIADVWVKRGRLSDHDRNMLDIR
jgi:hypothetical protein